MGAPMDAPHHEVKADTTAAFHAPEPTAMSDAPEVDAPVPSAPQHHDFLNWKPANDEEMVSNVLGMVAGLTSGKGPKTSEETEAPPAEDSSPPVKAVDPPAQVQVQPEAQPEPRPQIQPSWANHPDAHPQPEPQQQLQHRASVLSFDWGNTYGDFQSKQNDAPAPASLPVQQTAPRQDLSNNPYLKGIDFSSELSPATMSAVTQNSYLASVNLNGRDLPKPKTKAEISSNDIGGPNKLTGFSWYN